MATLKELNAADLLKGTVAVVVAFVAVSAWMEGRFITSAMAKDYVKREKVDQLQRMITYQQLSMVGRDIIDEKKKPMPERDKEKLHILYQQESELKKDLGVK